MKRQTLEELAQEAEYALDDIIEDFDHFNGLDAIEKIKFRFAHADCDYFALVVSLVTGWNVVGVSNKTTGPLHRLVESPDGKLLDVFGFIELEELKKRYQRKALEVSRGGNQLLSFLEGDDDLVPVISAITYLDYAPFNEQWFKSKLEQVAKEIGLELEEDTNQKKSILVSRKPLKKN